MNFLSTSIIQLIKEYLSYFLSMSFHGNLLKSSVGSFRASAKILEVEVLSLGLVMLNLLKRDLRIGSSGLPDSY